MEGVIQIHINPLSEKALVEYETEKIDLPTIKDAILKTGYKVMDMLDKMPKR
ncbi:MAG: heavy-metal-associated domain-containing protein [Nitrososphaerales archaeon]